MERITIANLQAICDRINRTMGTPAKAYERGPDDRLVAQIGNYHLDQAYSGVSLWRMVNESGGISNVLGAGHVTRRDLYDQMHAFLRGIEAAREQVQA